MPAARFQQAGQVLLLCPDHCEENKSFLIKERQPFSAILNMPYNRKYWQFLYLAVWPQTVCKKNIGRMLNVRLSRSLSSLA